MKSVEPDTGPAVEPGEVLTWEEKRVHRFVHGLEATTEQRLSWLEEAIRLAWETGALPRPRNG